MMKGKWEYEKNNEEIGVRGRTSETPIYGTLRTSDNGGRR
jgi:hypothetical protein